jgi:hypothetical protein
MAAHVNAYLDDPTLDRDARRRLVELEVDVAPVTAGTRILDVLDRLAR